MLEAKSISILYKAKDLLNQASLYTLYCSFILPYIKCSPSVDTLKAKLKTHMFSQALECP